MVDSFVINEHSDSSRDQCINEGITEESAEVSMTKEGAVKEPTAILISPPVEMKMSQLMLLTAGGLE